MRLVINPNVQTLLLSLSLLALTCTAKANERLSDFQWQQRVLVVKGSEPSDFSKLIRYYEDNKHTFKERRLMLIMIAKNRLFSCLPSLCEKWQKQDLSNIKVANKMMLLIGLDGREKAVYPKVVSALQDVFRDIDDMPMRRAETKEFRHDANKPNR